MGVREVGYKTYWACERVITPGLQYSQCNYRDVPLLAHKRRWLDIGCGHRLFAQWMHEDQRKAIASCEQAFGCDLDFEGMRQHPDLRNKCMASGYGLPYASGSMDIITANMVTEHVDDPETFFGEVERVLVPGGLFVFHTPNRHGYPTMLTRMVSNQSVRNMLDGRKEEDVFPTFYRDNEEEFIHRIAARRGLTCPGHRVGGDQCHAREPGAAGDSGTVGHSRYARVRGQTLPGNAHRDSGQARGSR